MNSSRVLVLSIGLSCCVFAVAAVRWQRALAPKKPAVAQVNAPVAERLSTFLSESTLIEALSYLVENDPFRLSNTPPRQHFDARGDAGHLFPSTAVRAQRPVLVLKAILGGPPWQAVIDGLPGQPPGTIAREGGQYDKLLVSSVTSDSAVVRGLDTLWVLKFR